MTRRTKTAYDHPMLNLSCQRIGRRNFLRLGALGGACMPGLLEARTLLSQNPKPFPELRPSVSLYVYTFQRHAEVYFLAARIQ